MVVHYAEIYSAVQVSETRNDESSNIVQIKIYKRAKVVTVNAPAHSLFLLHSLQ